MRLLQGADAAPCCGIQRCVCVAARNTRARATPYACHVVAAATRHICQRRQRRQKGTPMLRLRGARAVICCYVAPLLSQRATHATPLLRAQPLARAYARARHRRHAYVIYTRATARSTPCCRRCRQQLVVTRRICRPTKTARYNNAVRHSYMSPRSVTQRKAAEPPHHVRHAACHVTAKRKWQHATHMYAAAYAIFHVARARHAPRRHATRRALPPRYAKRNMSRGGRERG